MPWTAVVNPAAGRGRTRRLLPELTAALGAVDDVEVHVSDSPDAPVALARRAADAGRDLVAVGGDGLVGTLAGIAASTGRRLAVVPSGAGNDFARNLGYDPKRPLDALRVLGDAGTDRTVDLGRVNGRAFTTVAAIGFDAEANRWANTVTRLSGTPLYVAAVLRTLVRYRPKRFRLTIDTAEIELDAWLIASGNGPAYGGGMRIAPRASLDDGLLDVVVVGPMSVGKLLVTFPKVFRGAHERHPAVTIQRGRQVRIEALDADLEAYADGERVGPLPAAIDAWPDALVARVPH
ncbi:MAG TPA: diacylglycerol kinase family protein [Acidimicrobiia bacterium]|nr:diacylglycerol kinase family protein [Acidimicrobiia bacterium]